MSTTSKEVGHEFGAFERAELPYSAVAFRAGMLASLLPAALAAPSKAQTLASYPTLVPSRHHPIAVRTEDISDTTLALCVKSSTCPEMMLVAGDAASSTLVVFLHTTFDAGFASFYRLFHGWAP